MVARRLGCHDQPSAFQQPGTCLGIDCREMNGLQDLEVVAISRDSLGVPPGQAGLERAFGPDERLSDVSSLEPDGAEPPEHLRPQVVHRRSRHLIELGQERGKDLDAVGVAARVG